MLDDETMSEIREKVVTEMVERTLKSVTEAEFATMRAEVLKALPELVKGHIVAKIMRELATSSYYDTYGAFRRVCDFVWNHPDVKACLEEQAAKHAGEVRAALEKAVPKAAEMIVEKIRGLR